MKKVSGWLFILISSFFLLLFSGTLILMAYERFFHPDPMKDFPLGFGAIVGFVTMMALAVSGLLHGLKKVRKQKQNVPVEYTGTIDLKLSGQIGFKDYRNMLFQTSLKKTPVFVFLAISLMVILAAMNGNDQRVDTEFSFLPFLLIGVFIGTPLLIHVQAKKFYNTNSIFREPLDYHITNECLKIKGTTVDSTQFWSHFFKLKQTKQFVLLYHGENVATLLDKKMFEPEQLSEFLIFTQSLNLIVE